MEFRIIAFVVRCEENVYSSTFDFKMAFLLRHLLFASRFAVYVSIITSIDLKVRLEKYMSSKELKCT